MTWKASWSKGRLVLRGRCAAAPCRGSVTVKLRSSRTFRTSLRTTKTVGTRSYTTKALRLKVSAKVRTRLRTAARRRVALTVRSTLTRERASERRDQAAQAYSSRKPILSVTW